MNRKYTLKQFLLGLVINVVIFHFYLFIPGVILCLIGIAVKHCLYIGIALLIFDLIISFISQLKIRKTILSDSDDPEFNDLMDAYCDPDDPDAFKEKIDEKIRSAQEQTDDHQNFLEKLVVYRTLKASIHVGMTLEEMIDAFAEMCKISVGEPDDLLFETGNYNFTGEKMFYFSLARQFQFLDDNEYVQLRLEVTYAPSPKTALCYTTKWGSLTDGDFFAMVKGSRAFRIARGLPIAEVNVRIEET